MGKERFQGIHLFDILLLAGGEVFISGVDMDSFPGAYPAIPRLFKGV
jgi:hypothetical protein